ncbi:MAG: cell division protein FtsQ [Pseudomonadota bacterium]
MLRHLFLASVLLGGSAAHAEVQLYETGPSEDSSFLRFVNASGQTLDIEAGASKARLSLTNAAPTSGFQPVRARSEIKGALIQGGERQDVALSVQPGEFVSVIGIQDGKGGIAAKLLREKPDSFNALKASLGFASLDSACSDAGLKAAGRDVMIFEHGSESIQRRMINPVALAVQLVCAGKPVGAPLDLGSLQAGQRYSLFVVPAAQGSHLMYSADTILKN